MSPVRNKRQLRFVRRCVTDDSAKMLVHAFISSRVDLCNSLLFEAMMQVTRKLQAVLNSFARLIPGLRRSNHITPALRKFRWLPIEQRVTFKIAFVVVKCQHRIAPSYIADF
jgi:hypothetical protein